MSYVFPSWPADPAAPAARAQLRAENEQAWALRLERPDAARTLALDALSRASAAGVLGEAARARLTLAVLALRAGEPPGPLRDTLEAVSRVFDSQSDRVGQLRAAAVRALLIGDGGDRPLAMAMLRNELDAAREVLDGQDIVVWLNLLANFELEEGHPDAARTTWYEALERGRAGGEPPELTMVLINLGVLHLRACDFGTAALLLDDAFGRVERLGQRAYRLVCAGNLATARLLEGRADQALALLDPLLAEADEAFDLFDRVFFGTMHAQASARTGQVARARRALDACTRLAPGVSDRQLAGPLRLAEAEVLLAEGRLAEADIAIDALLGPELIDDDALHYEQLRLRAEWLRQQGSWRAATAAERARHRFLAARVQHRAPALSQQVRYELFCAQLEHGYQRAARGRAERALAEIETAHRRLAQRVAEVEALQARLREEALRDPLTGLYNRRFLAEVLPRELDVATREGGPLSLAMLDVDGFKRFNDTHGHAAGDAVLQRLAETALRHAPVEDACFRYGGEEFCLVLPRTALPQAIEVLQRTLEAFGSQPIEFGGQPVQGLSFSAGVAEAHPGESPEGLLARADAAQYDAKRNGRRRVCAARPPEAC